MDQTIKQLEEKYLSEVKLKIQKSKQSLNETMQAMGAENLARLQELRESPETGLDFFIFLEQLHEKNETFNFKDKYKILEEYEYLLKEPYFARIDLKNPETNKERTLYIGKFGFTDDGPVVTDWRSKIASVYYRYRYPQKNVSYDTPDGKQIRDLTLKRTFEIDDGELIKYYNNDIQLDEEQIIVDKIEQRTGGVLEDIIETIQESQLDIIEADPRQICMVQGCVGSGKSTVAIHKLSHIFFNYPNYIHAERSVLVAKNQILVGYLSTLFPKLGIFDINYKTLKDLMVQAIFREEMGIKFDLDSNEDTKLFDISQIQKVYDLIDEVHSEYEQEINDVFDRDEEFGMFKSFKYDKNATPYQNIIDISNDLEEELGMQKDSLKENPNSTRAWLYKENISSLRKILTRLRKLRDRAVTTTLKNVSRDLGIDVRQELDYLQTLKYLFIYSELIGFRNVLEYEYCVVDEGQDFSPLEYIVLSKYVLRGRLAIFGDLNQSIESDGIKSWEDIPMVIKEAKKAARFELKINYRSTKQIIDLANKILKPYTDTFLPQSINRIGDEPVIRKFESKERLLENFKAKMSSDVVDLNKSIGIITFNPNTYYDVEQILDELNLPSDQLIKLDSTKRISYIPKGVYLSRFEDCKGLEFSKVYVLDLDIDKISDFSFAKKAFVAITRAMNEVEILS